MNILIINFMQIGDLMLTTPVFHALKLHDPNCNIALAADARFRDLVRHNPFINQFFFHDKRSLKDLLGIIRDVRHHHFDFCINLHRNERASALAAASGANRIIGYSKPGFSLAFDSVVPNLKNQMHQVYSHFNVLGKAGFHNLFNPGLELFIPDDISVDMNRFWYEHFNQNDKVVAFNVGASWPSKRWLPEYFAQCADTLIESGFHAAFLGSADDLPIVNSCVSFMHHKPHIFTGQFSLLQLAAFFDHCRLLITNDSGPMHIAVARNLPLVTVFGSSPVIGFYPFNSNDFLIKSPVHCHPCFNHLCNNNIPMACMKAVTPDIALKYSFELLDKYGQSAKDIPRVYGDYDCKIVELDK